MVTTAADSSRELSHDVLVHEVRRIRHCLRLMVRQAQVRHERPWLLHCGLLAANGEPDPFFRLEIASCVKIRTLRRTKILALLRYFDHVLAGKRNIFRIRLTLLVDCNNLAFSCRGQILVQP